MTLHNADLLDQAVRACRTREHFSPFPDRPGRNPGTQAAIDAAEEAFHARLGTEVVLTQPADAGLTATDEASPYSRSSLGISYPHSRPDALFAAAEQAGRAWRQVAPEVRVDRCLDIVVALHERWFDLAHANQHTTGQSFSMSCIGSGTNALDRGIEAVAYASEAMRRVPREGRYVKHFGDTPVRLAKRYQIRPRGTAVVITCASFPTWNAYPAILANLATGNPVIVKPHPTSILTMALAVEVAQRVLADAGHPPELVQLAVDTVDEPVTKQLITHPGCRIVDFTGSPAFGAWIEANAHPARVYTETAGVNAVVLHSVADLEATAAAIATSLNLFTAQMCTSVQNLYLPADGIDTPDGRVPVDEVLATLRDAVDAIALSPKRAAGVLGAVQSPGTVPEVERWQAAGQRLAAEGHDVEVVRAAGSYAHPAFAGARTLTPAMLSVTPAERELFGEERFGPISFAVRCADGDDALEQAITDVAAKGSIASHLYTTDADYQQRAIDAFLDAGASLSVNLTGPMPLNFAAAYSDYHVTGLNPAGSACLTDEAFIAGRFGIVQVREPAAAPPADA